jgi:hypothetical protein
MSHLRADPELVCANDQSQHTADKDVLEAERFYQAIQKEMMSHGLAAKLGLRRSN